MCNLQTFHKVGKRGQPLHNVSFQLTLMPTTNVDANFYSQGLLHLDNFFMLKMQLHLDRYRLYFCSKIRILLLVSQGYPVGPSTKFAEVGV